MNDRIVGWEEIAKALGRALKRSVTSRTAKRYAMKGRDNRLLVKKYPSSRSVWCLPAWIESFRLVEEEGVPLGAVSPGARAPNAVIRRARSSADAVVAA